MRLPDQEHETRKLGRQYLINVLYTSLGEKFKQWVDVRVEKRHQEVKEEGKKYIELDPEIHKLFTESKAVSTSNGKAYHMMKASASRRRTKQQIKEEKQAEEMRQLEIASKIKQFDLMQQEMAELQKQMQNHQALLTQASTLYEQGLLKQHEDGSWVAVNGIEEQQAVLAEHQKEAAHTQKLEEEVNVRPPPSIGSDR